MRPESPLLSSGIYDYASVTLAVIADPGRIRQAVALTAPAVAHADPMERIALIQCTSTSHRLPQFINTKGSE